MEKKIKVKSILVTQPKPETDKSPFYDLAKKLNLKIDFRSFIHVEGIPAKDFRKEKISPLDFTAVIFTSRNAIDHYFRICEEMKIEVPAEMKYFCITEAVALYLQKFILYRKRKVFYGADGSSKSMLDVINKHKENEKFLYVCSENQQDNDICGWLKLHKCSFDLAFMYRSISNDITPLFAKKGFEIICFFTPSGVKSLFDNFPDFKQNKVVIGAFGSNTSKAVEDAKLRLDIKAPAPQRPSLVAALDHYLQSLLAKK